MPNHTIAENLQRLQAAKTAIGAAITAKGGTVGANDGLEDFASDIATMPSGGVEFKNTPTDFKLMSNIINLDVIVPNGCTSIGQYAFSGCTGLTSIEIPDSVTSIGQRAFSGCTGLTSIEIPDSVNTIEYGLFMDCTGLTSIEIPNSVTSISAAAFSGCTGLEKIYIDKDENTIAGSPWGAPNTPQVIWRTNRYQASCAEVASGTTLTGTVNATVGDLVVATFAIRGNTYTFDSGWTLLGIGDNGALNQRTAMAYKIATSSSESLTVTQDTSGRMYINLVSITGASVGTFSGFTTQATGTGASITLPKPQGLVIWGVSATYWSTQTPYKPWVISDTNNMATIQLPTSTQPRCLTALDQSNNASETFTGSADGDSAITAASLTITGIDNFWYYDNS